MPTFHECLHRALTKPTVYFLYCLRIVAAIIETNHFPRLLPPQFIALNRQPPLFLGVT
jgi:hypothetical protein